MFVLGNTRKEIKLDPPPEISENPCISKAPLKTNLEAESNC